MAESGVQIGRVRRIVLGIVLGIVTALAYQPGLRAPFLFDDKRDIVYEPAIKPPISLGGVLGSDRPVVTASLALNYAWGDLDPFGYHLLNLGAHLLTGLLIYGWFRSILQRPRLAPYAGRSAAIAGVATAVFLLHPLQTESVTYTIQRAEIFGALALVACVRLADGAPSPGRLAALLAAGLFGVWSKETVAAAPAVFAVLHLAGLASEDALRSRARLFIAYGTLGAVALASAAWGITHADEEHIGFGMAGLGPLTYLSYQPGVLLHYLRLALWPDRLCFDCGFRAPWAVRASLLGDAVWGPALVLCALGAAAIAMRRRAPLVTVAMLGSAVVLAPSSSVYPLADVYVEHRVYLALALLALPLAAAGLHERVPRIAGHAMIALVLGALAAKTALRNTEYTDPVRIYRGSIAIAPDVSRPRYNLGNALARQGEHEAALVQYLEVTRLDPTWPYGYAGAGLVHRRAGRVAEAIAAFETARRLGGATTEILVPLYRLYSQTGRTDDALAVGREAAERHQLDFPTAVELAQRFVDAGRRDDAILAYRAALALQPNEGAVRRALQRLERAGGGRDDEAGTRSDGS